MEYSAEHSLTIKLTNEGTENELDIFLNVLNKCNKEAKRSGYKKMFNKDECGLIRALHNEFLGDEKVDTN